VTPEALARACADHMWGADRASAELGMAIQDVRPGAARVSMRVQPRMLNGYGICHGGFIFALADTAFAFACNTDGMVSVAAHCSIAYLRPARDGELLVATAEERQREGRSGIYDVRVTVAEAIVAEFRGHSRTTGARMELAGAG
jgi:acyl-CoA thioesterase